MIAVKAKFIYIIGGFSRGVTAKCQRFDIDKKYG